MNEKPHLERLKHLANHLLHGKRYHAEFTFAAVIRGDLNNLGCGTAGCALGELPGAWPEDFTFDPKSGRIVDLTQPPHMRETDRWGTRGTYVLACNWFWLQTWMFNLLFLPGAECMAGSELGGLERRELSLQQFGVKRLSRDATAEEVANNILKFCEFYEQQEKEVQC